MTYTPEYDRAVAVQNEVTDRLMALPGVHGTSVGIKRVRNVPVGIWSLRVHVSVKRPLSEIAPEYRIPATIEGVPTDVLQHDPPATSSAAPASDFQAPGDDPGYYRPIVGGSQIAVTAGNNMLKTGTLGCFAGMSANPNGGVLILTCQHVVAPSTDNNIYQPDASESPVATITNQALDANLDAAICQVGDLSYTNSILDVGTVYGGYNVGPWDIENGGYPVSKRGRTTGLTSGVITSITYTCKHPTSGIRMTGQMFINANQAPFAQPGDSGSAIVNGSVNVCGLLWGIDSAGTGSYGVANRMPPLNDELGIGIQYGANRRSRVFLSGLTTVTFSR